MSLGIYRHIETRDLYLVEHADDLCVYGQREFDRDGSMRPWSMRLRNFRAAFTIDVDLTTDALATEQTP